MKCKTRFKLGLHGVLGHRVRMHMSASEARAECECGWTHTETGNAAALLAWGAHAAHEETVRGTK